MERYTFQILIETDDHDLSKNWGKKNNRSIASLQNRKYRKYSSLYYESIVWEETKCPLATNVRLLLLALYYTTNFIQHENFHGSLSWKQKTCAFVSRAVTVLLKTHKI